MREKLKILGLQVDGLRKLKAINMQFKEEGLTQILGPNEQGKTTLAIDSVQILIRGNKYANKDIVGHGKSKATLIGKIGPYKITRIIPKEGTPTLKVVDTRTNEPMKGRVQDFLDAMVNELTFNPRPFLDRNREQKLKFMMDLCKIDFSKVDSEINSLYNKRTLVGQEKDRFGEIVVPKKVERVDTSDIINKKKAIADENEKLRKEFESAKEKELKEIEDFNKVQRERAKSLEVETDRLSDLLSDKEYVMRNIERVKKELEELELELKNNENNIIDCKTKLETLEEPEPEKPLISKLPEPEYKSVSELDNKLAKAAETNQLANEYDSQVKRQQEKEQKDSEYKELTQQIDALRKQKLETLTKTKTGVDGLTITEEDILYKGISSDNWSDAQGLMIASQLCIAQMPELNAVFLDRAESMDKKTFNAYVQWAEKNKIQVIVVRVADEMPRTKEDNVYYIVDGSIVESEDENEN